MAALVGLTAACAGSPYQVAPSATAFLPQEAANAQPSGLRAVLPGEALFTTPVGWRSAAQLDGDASGSIIGKDFLFEKGETLPVATITGTAAGGFARGTVALCGTPQVNAAKTLLAASTLGITSIFNRTGASWQVCLLDTDSDGRLDRAILAGVKKAADATPIAIEPVPYRLMTNAVMPGESQARIVYRGETGLIGGHVSFDLQVTENGQPLIFGNVRTKVDLDKLPQPGTLMGTQFTVLAYDPADGHVSVQVQRGFQPGNYGLHTSYTTQYIPIYIPR